MDGGVPDQTCSAPMGLRRGSDGAADTGSGTGGTNEKSQQPMAKCDPRPAN